MLTEEDCDCSVFVIFFLCLCLLLVRSCFLITLSKCLKSHKSLQVFVKVANEEANFVMDMEVEKVADMVLNMEDEKVANELDYMVLDMEVDNVTDELDSVVLNMEVDKVGWITFVTNTNTVFVYLSTPRL